MTMESVQRLSRDVIEAAKTMTDKEARYFIDAYYIKQDARIRAEGQVRSMSEEPHSAILWQVRNEEVMERQMVRVLDAWSLQSVPGRWMRSILGLGPVLSANFLAHIDIHRAPTAGNLWSFAGFNPAEEWNKGEKRPWNAELKKRCWLAASSWVRLKARADSFYSQVYIKHKERAIARNDAGGFAELAAKQLTKKNYSRDTKAKDCYQTGTLPPGHLEAYARRNTIKLFLSHLHQVMYEDAYGKPAPMPYALVHLAAEHAHFIPPPHWPLDADARPVSDEDNDTPA